MTSKTPKSVTELRNKEASAMAGIPPAPEMSSSQMAVFDDPTFGLLNPAVFEHLYRIATGLSRSQLIPKIYQGKVDDCFVAVQMAITLRCQPMVVLQNLYIVNGNPGFSTKFAIALANERGPFDGVIMFKDNGVPPIINNKLNREYAVTAYARIRATGQMVERTVSMGMAEDDGWTKNPKYRSLPEQMLSYRAATFLIRLYCPEVLFGMQTDDEMIDGGTRYVDAEIVGRTSVGEVNYGNPQEADNHTATEMRALNQEATANDVSQNAEGNTAQESAGEPAKKEVQTGAEGQTSGQEPPAKTTLITVEQVKEMIGKADANVDDDYDLCRDMVRSFPKKDQAELNKLIDEKFGARTGRLIE